MYHYFTFFVRLFCISLGHLLGHMAAIFVEDFCTNFDKGYWPLVFVLVMPLSGFGIREIIALQNELESGSSFYFLEEFEKD